MGCESNWSTLKFKSIQKYNKKIDLNLELRTFETNLIVAALDSVGWNQTKAAEKLGIKRTTLIEKMRKYGMKKG